MKEFFYYNVLRKSTQEILNIFNDIRIARYHADGTVRKMIKVPLRFAPKEKHYNWLFSKTGSPDNTHRSGNVIQPIISLQITGVDYDESRQVNKTTKIMSTESPSGGYIRDFLNPVPYNVTYELSIFSKNMDDITQIIEQILPFFSPELFIVLYIPQLTAHMKLKVIYDSSSPGLDVDIGESEYRMLRWDMGFTLQGYLFKPLELTKNIKTIILSYFTNSDIFDQAEAGTIAGQYDDEDNLLDVTYKDSVWTLEGIDINRETQNTSDLVLDEDYTLEGNSQ